MNESKQAKTGLLVLAGVRGVLSLLAVPLAPALYRKHFLVLVLLRPTKEVLLAGGFLVKRGDVSLLPMLAAAVPLAIIGVWHFYALGLLFAKEIQTGKGLPRWAGRILPTGQIKKLCKVLERKGTKVVIIGRLAAFPSALLGAAAGASRMEPKRFLVSDFIGGMLSVAEVITAGFVFGEAYKEAGPWITGAGVALLIAMLVLVGRWIRRV